MRVLVTSGSDISLARKALGYEPKVTFEDGMQELCGWLAEQEATDLVDEATDALVKRGLTV